MSDIAITVIVQKGDTFIGNVKFLFDSDFRHERVKGLKKTNMQQSRI